MARKMLFLLVLVVSGFLFVTGAMFVVLYFWKGVVARIGQADQSLLFWYLPVLFMGLIAMGVGWTLGRWGWERFQSLSSEEE